MTPVAVAALAGGPAEAANEWVRTAAVAHIIAWRVDGYLRVDRSIEDFVLPAGKDATRWIFDRFSKTYPDEWLTTSHPWELVFNRQPAMTANRVGLPLSLLEERFVTDDAIIGALDRRLTSPHDQDVLESGLRTEELFEAIVALLEAREFQSACILARQSCEASPQVSSFPCSMPFVPSRFTLMRRALPLMASNLQMPPGRRCGRSIASLVLSSTMTQPQHEIHSRD
jgi:hypothetical protein